MKVKKKGKRPKIIVKKKTDPVEVEIRPEHEKLVKDIKKGQSMQMLVYIHKTNPFRVMKIARLYGLEVFDPMEKPYEREFQRGTVDPSAGIPEHLVSNAYC
jgi:hypothetical protein